MKRRELLRQITAIAKRKNMTATFKEGGAHTMVQIGGKATTIPRHNEINEHTARGILKHLSTD